MPLLKKRNGMNREGEKESMIYTVTFNPALDYVVRMEDMVIGRVNRTNFEEVYVGGKGVNVSLILKELGEKSVALGFVAGFTGRAIQEGLTAMSIESGMIELEEGLSRINVKIKADDETEINARGPRITNEAIEQLYEKLDDLMDGDVLVLAGSIPDSLPEDIYEKIMARLQEKDISIVVDATKDLLRNVLKYRPFLIKPNNYELGEIFHTELNTDEEIIEHAKLLQKEGARNVLISMAGNGAILVDEKGESHRIGVPKGKVKNSVGAGDSMVAGFLAGYRRNMDYQYALELGTASGSATAFADGLATCEEIEKLLNEITKR